MQTPAETSDPTPDRYRNLLRQKAAIKKRVKQQRKAKRVARRKNR